MKEIGLQELADLAVGATLLGTGGGGDPFIGRLMAEAAISRYGPVRLADAEELPDEGLVVPAAMMGAPTVMVEKIPNGREIETAVATLEKILDKTAVAVMTIEAGGINSMIPLAVAAQMNLPVIDGDSMGRAFPELQMTSFHVFGLKATPMALVDEKGNSLVIDAIDNPWTERLARTATVAVGGASIIALYPMTGRAAKRSMVRGTLTKAMDIGHLLGRSRRSREEKLNVLREQHGAVELFTGKVVDVERRSGDGFARGTVSCIGLGAYADRVLRIEFQNENLIAMCDGRVVATVPDLICVADRETLMPITTEGLMYGQRIVAFGLPCDPVWLTEKGMETVGPHYFGYEIDYVPLAGARARAAQ
ncbi:MAG: DUF917 domain-containing protein [Thermaerobacter sp.]|nr:DUF917 domain-containing protein [Thermaerobacter sp.]